MSSQELALIEDDDDGLGLSAKQVTALEKLAALGAEPAALDPATGKSIYDKNPQIRALQMVFEGKFGGAGRGQGRSKQGRRAAEVLADEIRGTPHITKMKKALDRALSRKAGVRANLDAVKLSIEIERGERALQIKEEEHEESLDKDELIGAIIESLANPAVVSALEGEAEEITDAAVVEDNKEESVSDYFGDSNGQNGASNTDNVVKPARAKRASASSKKVGDNSGKSRTDERARPKRSSSKAGKSVGKAKNSRTPK